jgi:hypothetical protein
VGIEGPLSALRGLKSASIGAPDHGVRKFSDGVRVPLWTLAVCIVIGTLASLELGYRLGERDRARGERFNSRGISVIESAVFALLGLLLAFSFSGAAARFEARRHLITTEVNAISTAWLRLDLLPTETQGEVRAIFREYTDLRGRFFRPPFDEAAVTSRKETQVRLETGL